MQRPLFKKSKKGAGIALLIAIILFAIALSNAQSIEGIAFGFLGFVAALAAMILVPWDHKPIEPL